ISSPSFPLPSAVDAQTLDVIFPGGLMQPTTYTFTLQVTDSFGTTSELARHDVLVTPDDEGMDMPMDMDMTDDMDMLDDMDMIEDMDMVDQPIDMEDQPVDADMPIDADMSPPVTSPYADAELRGGSACSATPSQGGAPGAP